MLIVYLTLPFSTITCRVEKPVFIDSKISAEDFEKKRKEIENLMVKRVYEMDAEFGHKPVEQDLNAHDFKQALREQKAQKKAKKKGK